MADKNSSKNNFIMQAGILAAAGIISRIIGLLYRGPLQSVIGNLGLGYYQSAYNYYTIILLISSYSIPSAISKAIAQKLGEKEYRNAHRLFHGAMIYVLVVGGIASLFLFFGAGLFVSGAAVTVLRTFAPTIFVYGILGVLRGYFQAHKSMAQTSVSQILEQIANAVVSVGAAYLLIQMFMGTMEVPADQAGQVMRATYGAVGSALGTGVGVLVALLFMAGVYALNRGMILRRVQRDRHEHVDSYGQIFRTITLVVTPFILSTAVYNLSSTVNNSIYTKWYPSLRNLDTVSIYEKYGIFSGQSLTMSNIPIAFASAMASAMIPSVAQLMAARDVKGAREKIGLAVKTTMVISIPCAVGLFVLAKPVISLLFTNKTAEELNIKQFHFTGAGQSQYPDHQCGDLAGGADGGSSIAFDVHESGSVQHCHRQYAVFRYDVCAEPVGGKKSGRLPTGDRKDFCHSGVRLCIYGSGSLGNLRRSVYGDEVHADLCHSGDHDRCGSLFCHADIDAGHHGAGASQLPEGISAGKGGEEVPLIEITDPRHS